jgi:hypothetical protein
VDFRGRIIEGWSRSNKCSLALWSFCAPLGKLTRGRGNGEGLLDVIGRGVDFGFVDGTLEGGAGAYLCSLALQYFAPKKGCHYIVTGFKLIFLKRVESQNNERRCLFVDCRFARCRSLLS